MVQLIIGNTGKGKTKHLLDKVNTQVKEVSGSIVYLDKSGKHMFELNNRIRLIDVSEYLIDNYDEFIGFILGIISQDHDLEQMYLDSFLTIAHLEKQDLGFVVSKLEQISEKFNVEFVLSVGIDKKDLAETLQDKVIVSL